MPPFAEDDKTRKSICLVTNEIYPFAPGGIGRLISNWIEQNALYDEQVDISLLLPQALKSKLVSIEEHFENKIRAIFFVDDVKSTTYQAYIADSLRKDNWDFFQAYSVSYDYFLALHGLQQRGVCFDVVEFPDYGGWGAVSIEAKRAKICLENSLITIRLHSSFGLIREVEKYYHQPSGWSAGMVDLEHFSIKHADIIVGHLPAIIQKNKDFYKLGEKWLQKVVLETPPILISDNSVDYNRIYKTATNFVFSSRLQPFKRPDLFIKAACIFFDHNTEADCKALLVSYGWDQSYIGWLRRLIPKSKEDKILILTSLSQQQRYELLKSSIVVIPSDYESYCLFAYESALAGNKVLLKKTCLAFGSHSAWEHGSNCLMFEDDPNSLAEIMKEAIVWRPKSTLITQADVPYWHNVSRKCRSNTKESLEYRVIIYDIDAGDRFRKACALRKSLKLENVTFVLNGGYGVLENPSENDAAAGFDVFYPKYGDDVQSEIWQLAGRCTEEAIIFLSMLDEVDKNFCSACQYIMSENRDVGVVTCNDVVLDLSDDQLLGINFAAGEHASTATSGSSIVGRSVCVRRSVILENHYPEHARDHGWHAAFKNIAQKGVGICVIPEIMTRTYVMDRSMSDPACVASMASDAMLSSPLFCTGAGIGSQTRGQSIHPSKLVRYEMNEFSPVQKIWPLFDADWGKLVNYDSAHDGWLVHPMDNQVVVARLRIDAISAPIRLFVEVENVQQDNDGFVFSLYPGEADWKVDDIPTWVEQKVIPSNSYLVKPGESKILFCDAGHSERTIDLYLISRTRPGGKAHNCGAIVRAYGAIT